ncbi:MAG TPA: hypothetical protein VE973_00485 [Candidatus Limnocylindria bacterium]|nr:hypothetical protein [Candidatus Limnocylindria bacterium]
MTDFLKQDIFFFVTTIAVVLLTILLIVICIFLIKIFKDIKYITNKAKNQADLISEDLSDLREGVRKGIKIKSIFDFFNNLRKKRKG